MLEMTPEIRELLGAQLVRRMETTDSDFKCDVCGQSGTTSGPEPVSVIIDSDPLNGGGRVGFSHRRCAPPQVRLARGLMGAIAAAPQDNKAEGLFLVRPVGVKPRAGLIFATPTVALRVGSAYDPLLELGFRPVRRPLMDGSFVARRRLSTRRPFRNAQVTLPSGEFRGW